LSTPAKDFRFANRTLAQDRQWPPLHHPLRYGAMESALAGGGDGITSDTTCGDTIQSPRVACDLAKKQVCEELVQDNILWRVDDPDNSASRHWQEKNLDDLCACTTDPYATVNCFQIQVNNNRKSWQEGIETCRAKPGKKE